MDNRRVPRDVAVCPRCSADLFSECESRRDGLWRIVVDHSTVTIQCDNGHGPKNRKDALVWGAILDRVYGWLTDEEA